MISDPKSESAETQADSRFIKIQAVEKLSEMCKSTAFHGLMIQRSVVPKRDSEVVPPFYHLVYNNFTAIGAASWLEIYRSSANGCCIPNSSWDLKGGPKEMCESHGEI
jgi:hypothetical protein